MAIGIFDSGMGGITVLNEISKKYKNEDIYFFADSLRLPYGEKTKDEILQYCKNIVEFLLKKNVDLIVIACNTATAVALDELKKIYNVKIIGVIEPVLIKAISKNCKDLVLFATTATVNSKKYEESIKKIDENINLISKACPLYVPLIEKGNIDWDEISKTTDIYMKDINNNTTLILGCTHYSILKTFLSKKYPTLDIIDSSVEIAKYIENNKLIKNDKKSLGQIKYYVSGSVEQFKENLKNIFNIENVSVEKVE